MSTRFIDCFSFKTLQWLTSLCVLVLATDSMHGQCAPDAILLSENYEPNSGFGEAVDIDGDTIIVGAPNDEFESTDAKGSATVFRLTDGRWLEEALLIPPNIDDLSGAGDSVAISGNVALVADSGSAFMEIPGVVYVFRKVRGVWTFETTLTNPDESFWFGSDVAVDGDVALVGDSVAPEASNNAGAAYVFRYNGVQWELEAELLASDGEENDAFGSAVDLRGDTAVIGSPHSGTVGAAYIFENTENLWQQTAFLPAPENSPAGLFGLDVAVGDDFAVIGGSFNNDGSEQSRSAYVFREMPGKWILETDLTVLDFSETSHVGIIVGAGSDIASVSALFFTSGTVFKAVAYAFRDVAGE